MALTRRTFCVASSSALLLPMAARAGDTVDYTPGLVDQRLAAGETLFVDFAADWCSTCRAQERVIAELRGANPDYDNAMTFVRVDWDAYSGDALTQRLSIPRRSTLVVLRGNRELGRIVAGTRRADIETLMNAGLA